MTAQFKRFNPPGVLSEQQVGRLLTYGASRSVPSLPRAPDPAFPDSGGSHTAAQPGSSRPPPSPSGHSDPSAPGPSEPRAGARFTQYAIDSSSSDEEHVVYVDDVSDDASSVSHPEEIGLIGYVALLDGRSPMVTKMAEEDERKRKVAERERLNAWFEGLLSA